MNDNDLGQFHSKTETETGETGLGLSFTSFTSFSHEKQSETGLNACNEMTCVVQFHSFTDLKISE